MQMCLTDIVMCGLPTDDHVRVDAGSPWDVCHATEREEFASRSQRSHHYCEFLRSLQCLSFYHIIKSASYG